MPLSRLHYLDNGSLRLLGTPTDGQVPAGTLFGSAVTVNEGESKLDATQRTSKMFGGIDLHRSYDNTQGTGPYLDTYQAIDATIGCTSAYSFKILPGDILSGSRDAELEQFFAAFSGYWTYWHEPDDDIYKKGNFTPQDYRAAWARIRAVADANSPGGAYATFCMMEYSLRPSVAPSRPLLGDDGMWPGSDVIDVFGVDTYNTLEPTGTVKDPATLYGASIDFAVSQGVDWAIPEWGCTAITGDPGGRARFITEGVDYWETVRSFPPVYVAWWNAVGRSDFRLDNDTAALAAYRELCERN